jgi:hypothetical protein
MHSRFQKSLDVLDQKLSFGVDILSYFDNFFQNLGNILFIFLVILGLIHKAQGLLHLYTCIIMNNAFGVIKMMIISDATTWGLTSNGTARF